MKVQLREDVGERENLRGWLKHGQSYVVLAVECQVHPMVCYRIEGGDSRTPALFEVDLFEIVDPSISPSWVATHSLGGALKLQPVDWGCPGFWERFFDGELAEVSQYRAARDAMLLEHT